MSQTTANDRCRALIVGAHPALDDAQLPDFLDCHRVEDLAAARAPLESEAWDLMLLGAGSLAGAGQAALLPVLPTLIVLGRESRSLGAALPPHWTFTTAHPAALGQALADVRRREGPDGVELIATDPRTAALVKLTEKVAATQATVLLSGESGVGKEVFARHIHAASRHGEGPFVAINCAAIPESMLEAQLFGHEKGAFTGAQSARAGKFEAANKGTLLLDEISEMDLGLQAKLLRVLQEREIERLGGNQTIKLDVRVLATTNRDLVREVEQGRFRQDLYYRLSVFPVAIPPLRERAGDIVPLAFHLLARQTRALPRRRFTACALDALREHCWPGNVRELANVIQRALIFATGPAIDAEAIRASLLPAPGVGGAAAAARVDGGLAPALQQTESELIIEALEAGNGSRQRAAELLGISARTLRYKIARMRKAGVMVPG